MLILIRNFTVVSLLVFVLSFTSKAISEPSVSATSAILIDADTAEILYEKNAYEKRSMASTTKIMTGIIAVESGMLNETVTVTEKPYIEGTAIGFNKGDKLTLKDLCYALLLESGNDAALLISRYFSGTEDDFSLLMNEKAVEIGMKSTNFVTASGLDADEHYTTAYDMALLGAYAVKNRDFREICSSKSYKAEYIEPQITRYFSNHNRLLSSCDGAIGIKTGFTKKSGRCLVSACEREGKKLVAVTLNAPDDWNDHEKLYSYGYSLYEQKSLELDIPSEIIVKGSDKTNIKTGNPSSISVKALKNSTLTVKILLNKIIYAPVKKQDVLGGIIVSQNGKCIKRFDIVSLEDADIKQDYIIYKPTLFQRIADYIKHIFSKERQIEYDRR